MEFRQRYLLLRQPAVLKSHGVHPRHDAGFWTSARRRGIQAATAKLTERRTAREPGPAPRRASPHDQWLSEQPLTALMRRVAG